MTDLNELVEQCLAKEASLKTRNEFGKYVCGVGIENDCKYQGKSYFVTIASGGWFEQRRKDFPCLYEAD